MSRTTNDTLVWLAAVGLAFSLALISPNESSVMGQLPAHSTQSLNRTPISLPGGLPSDRTLALITFSRDQQPQADSWIEGLDLKNDTRINWLRIPVLNDPGTAMGRSEVEKRLLQRYTTEAERAKLVPLFTDRADFVRSAGLNSTEQGYAVVVNRQGDVLARVEGRFDPDKAQALRETLTTAP